VAEHEGYVLLDEDEALLAVPVEIGDTVNTLEEATIVVLATNELFEEGVGTPVEAGREALGAVLKRTAIELDVGSADVVLCAAEVVLAVMVPLTEDTLPLDEDEGAPPAQYPRHAAV